MRRFNGSSGFTLIELMVVVVVLGILARVAIPSYTQYVNRAKRAQARAEIQKAEGWIERFYTENNRYSDPLTTSTTNASFIARFGNPQVIPASGTANYRLTIATTSSTYTITATRTGPMSSDSCGNYSKTNTGTMTFSGTGVDCLK
jgi:type IV pilus assembly protein PilE